MRDWTTSSCKLNLTDAPYLLRPPIDVQREMLVSRGCDGIEGSAPEPELHSCEGSHIECTRERFLGLGFAFPLEIWLGQYLVNSLVETTEILLAIVKEAYMQCYH